MNTATGHRCITDRGMPSGVSPADCPRCQQQAQTCRCDHGYDAHHTPHMGLVVGNGEGCRECRCKVWRPTTPEPEPDTAQDTLF